eukprot:7935125-Alexandrium_andersonii.AAC.1
MSWELIAARACGNEPARVHTRASRSERVALYDQACARACADSAKARTHTHTHAHKQSRRTRTTIRAH